MTVSQGTTPAVERNGARDVSNVIGAVRTSPIEERCADADANAAEHRPSYDNEFLASWSGAADRSKSWIRRSWRPSVDELHERRSRLLIGISATTNVFS